MSPAVPHFGAHDQYGLRSKTSTRNRRHPRADRTRPTMRGPRANSMKRALIARHRDTSPTRAPRNWRRKGHRTSCRDDGYMVSLRRRKPPYPCEVLATRCRDTTRKSNAVRHHARLCDSPRAEPHGASIMQSANQLIRTQDARRESSKLSSAVHRRRARSYRLMRIVTGGGNSAERVLAAAAYDCPPRADDVYPAEACRPLNLLQLN